MAQESPLDDRYIEIAQAGTYDGEWEGNWQDQDSYTGEWEGTYADEDGYVIETQYEGTWNGEEQDERPVYQDGRHRMGRPRMDGHHMDGHHMGGRRPGPRFAYSLAEREEWLAQCRALRNDGYDRRPVYYEEERENNGGLLGGLLGAVVGGIAGNRIADGERLAGTLIGAGLGGIAGAVIGSAIGEDKDDHRIVYADDFEDEKPLIDYCEAYLINYERGYGPAQTARIAYAPVMMMPVASGMQNFGRGGRPMIHREIVIEEPREETAAPAPRRVIRRAVEAQPSKLQEIK
ncbi:glycine zipper 2TM domain-containing protein [Altererythrobacter aestuarii]|uniref:Glycine zipper 2TM domain-containing protein n=2 Tax=Alteraurantiacibacter aestuarii TaxID=650004 RepID=A0A844ZSP3_9SPHN|nr:glycine zipper 2TM domain-containing protein [Alteraurantiacibacter aestuarii]